MLYWIWTCVLVAIAIGTAFYYGGRGLSAYDKTGPLIMFTSTIAYALTVAASWRIIWSPLYSWLDNSLPQPGTDIHSLTAAVVVGGAIVVSFFLISIGPALIGASCAERKGILAQKA